MISLEITGLRLAPEPNMRGHWSARYKRSAGQQHVVRCALQSASARPPHPPLTVTIVRVGRKRCDDDNAIASAKAVRDSIASWLGIDDGDPRITWRYGQEVAKGYAVRIRIEGAP